MQGQLLKIHEFKSLMGGGFHWLRCFIFFPQSSPAVFAATVTGQSAPCKQAENTLETQPQSNLLSQACLPIFSKDVCPLSLALA